MDDWSLLPSRTAESEAAPNPQSTMTTTHYPSLPDELTRVKRPQPAPITHARKTRRLTPSSSPGNHATNPGQSPKTPINQGDPCLTATKLPLRKSKTSNGRLTTPGPSWMT